MANLATNITSIYEPDIWKQYFDEAMYVKNRLVTSGVFETGNADLSSKANSGGRVIDMPFYANLAHSSSVRSSVVTDTDDEIVNTGVTTAKDQAYLDYRAKSWGVANVVKYVAGSDPVDKVLRGYADWWTTEAQAMLIDKLTGCFATTMATTHTYDIASESIAGQSATTKIGSDAINEARFLLGDSFNSFAVIIMHSAVYKRLEALDLITFVPTSEQLSSQIPMYFGMEVLVDDSMTVTAGSTDGYKYTSYLFKRGAVAFEPVQLEELNAELYYEPKKGGGAGATSIITRNSWVMHPKGVKYDDTPAGDYPSDAELKAGANWTKVYQDKNIGIVQLITN